MLLILHVVAALAFFVDAGWQIWVAARVLLWIRTFAVMAGDHRYFSHRSFRTSRIGQFALALLAQSSSQRSARWWAAHHRGHHDHTDTERDLHSPREHGFVHAHMGWLYDANGATDDRRVKDLARYPELVVLNKLWWVPPMCSGSRWPRSGAGPQPPGSPAGVGDGP